MTAHLETAPVVIDESSPGDSSVDVALTRARQFPRLRYMGSKYALLPDLARVFDRVENRTAIDAFSGSGVVSYLLKCQGFSVTSNDFLNFPTVIAHATVVNSTERLTQEQVETICGPPADDRDFIRSTFDGLYFAPEDRRFLDSAWSHIDDMPEPSRSIALSSLILSAARKQPRGVFTFTDSSRYADGRRDLKLTMEQHFREHVEDYNRIIFDNGKDSIARCGDALDLPTTTPGVVYLDPPYAPPSDDADYMKRYHFLEGLSRYWRGVTIMEETRTKKIEKKYTPFAYKRTADAALRGAFQHFADAENLVVSYSSNALPGPDRIVELLHEVKSEVEVIEVNHRYHFGTHSAARRRNVTEYLFVASDPR